MIINNNKKKTTFYIHNNFWIKNCYFPTVKDSWMKELNNNYPNRSIKILYPISFSIDKNFKFREYNYNTSFEKMIIPKPFFFEL